MLSVMLATTITARLVSRNNRMRIIKPVTPVSMKPCWFLYGNGRHCHTATCHGGDAHDLGAKRLNSSGYRQILPRHDPAPRPQLLHRPAQPVPGSAFTCRPASAVPWSWRHRARLGLADD